MQTEISCGAVIFKLVNDAPLFLLVHSKSNGNWGFAKGHIEDGESEEETARREILEETGLARIEFIEGFRSEEVYMIVGARGATKGLPTQKRSIYFLCKTCEEPTLSPNDEISESRWFTAKEALNILPFDSQKQALNSALSADCFIRK